MGYLPHWLAAAARPGAPPLLIIRFDCLVRRPTPVFREAFSRIGLAVDPGSVEHAVRFAAEQNRGMEIRYPVSRCCQQPRAARGVRVWLAGRVGA